MQKQSLILMQALLGVISANFRMIYLQQDGESIIVTIMLESEDEDDLEEIEDLKSEFEALQESPIDYDFIIKITDADLSWPDDNIVVVFKRREF
ncbi:hypothetical protein [Pseudoalteromonas luteoviolacea]|nr:hypothetical protein [Pseudoalteromonas luteoviolacea]